MRKPGDLPLALPRRGFTTAQAISAGVGKNRLRSADVQHPFRGINLLSPGPVELESRCRALQEKLPAGARFCGLTAARLVGVPLPARLAWSSEVHVAVPRGHRTLVGTGIRGHTFLPTPGDTRDWHGLRISSPERIWCEVARDLTLVELVMAGDFLVHHRLPHTTIDRISREVDRWPGRRGARNLAAAAPLLDPASESPQESRLRVLLTLGGIGGLVANLEIVTTDGFRYRADLAIPEKRLVIEYQSDQFHGHEVRRADLTRKSRIEADRWYVMEVGAADLDDPDELCRRILRILASRP